MAHQHIAFIGAGNMASAIFCGLIEAGFPADHITAACPDADLLDTIAKRYGVNTTTDNAEAIRHAYVVVLAVKPQIMKSVCEPLSSQLKDGPLFISVAAGLKVDTLDHWLGGGQAIIRCMPNTPSLVGAGASGLYGHKQVKEDHRPTATELIEAVGIVERAREEYMLDVLAA